MNVLDATEVEYKNGYEKGKEDAVRDSDVVEVVRCRDCKHFGTSGCAMDVYAFDVVEEGFCSYGERMDGGKTE